MSPQTFPLFGVIIVPVLNLGQRYISLFKSVSQDNRTGVRKKGRKGNCPFLLSIIKSIFSRTIFY